MSDVTGYDPYAMPPGAIQEPPETLWKALRQIGPGIILAGSIVGSGELLLTTSLGAEWGFTFLWLIIFSCVVKVFIQIELGRYAISSGKPTLGALNELPGWKPRVHWQVWWWLIMLIATVSQLGAMTGGVAQAINLAFPTFSPKLIEWAGPASSLGQAIASRPEYPWAILTAMAAVLLLLSGGYVFLERVTTALVAGVTAITVVCVLALPATGFPIDPQKVLEGLSFQLPLAGIGAAFATFGITGVGASELYSYPYWCLEKGYARFAGPRSDDPEWARRANGWIRVLVLDAWVSMIVFTAATVAFYFLGATVLHEQGLKPEGKDMIETLAQMYVPAFGPWTKIVFLLGAWAVLFKTLYIASAGHARLTADFLSLGKFIEIPNAYTRMRMIRWLCVFYPTFALVLYLVFRNPRGMVVFGGFFQAATLPVISAAAIYLRYRRTDSRLIPSKLSDALLWFAFITISAVASYAIYDWTIKSFLPLLKELAKSSG
ncbi:MAG: Nramp family divalent metal transporter [Planctomycetaceae bacterium]|nr:Nramp family divalent metal transporter [Planctomycetaceae bacterium]